MDSLTICNVCKICKPNSDYINNNGMCYKCVYARKIAEYEEEKAKPLKRTFCKNCKKKLPPNRWAYCSQDCALYSKRINKHWTLQVKTDTKNWKKRFIF